MSPSTRLPGAGNSLTPVPVFAEKSLSLGAAVLQGHRNPREPGLRGDDPLPPELRNAFLEAADPGVDGDEPADGASAIRDDDLSPALDELDEPAEIEPSFPDPDGAAHGIGLLCGFSARNVVTVVPSGQSVKINTSPAVDKCDFTEHTHNAFTICHHICGGRHENSHDTRH